MRFAPRWRVGLTEPSNRDTTRESSGYRFDAEDVGIGHAATAGMPLTNEADHLGGVGRPVQQGDERVGVLVVADVKNDKAALDGTIMTATLFLSDTNAKALVVHALATKDAARGSPPSADD